MSSTVNAPHKKWGPNGDYSIEMNYGIRIYNIPPFNEKVPKVNQKGAVLKGGQRTNFHGSVPLLNGNQQRIGTAEVTKIVSARPQFMPLEEVKLCGFSSIKNAVKYVKKVHGDEFSRDGVLSVFHFTVKSLIS